jgi:hypothetical protein
MSASRLPRFTYCVDTLSVKQRTRLEGFSVPRHCVRRNDIARKLYERSETQPVRPDSA